jgi:hypothetical protein
MKNILTAWNTINFFCFGAALLCFAIDAAQGNVKAFIVSASVLFFVYISQLLHLSISAFFNSRKEQRALSFR